jgi:hypothetical protein
LPIVFGYHKSVGKPGWYENAGKHFYQYQEFYGIEKNPISVLKNLIKI